MSICKVRELPGRGLNVAQGWARYCSVGDEQFILVLLLSLLLLSIIILNNTIGILFCFNHKTVLISTHKILSFLCDSLPHCCGMTGEVRGSWWYLVAGWG